MSESYITIVIKTGEFHDRRADYGSQALSR